MTEDSLALREAAQRSRSAAETLRHRATLVLPMLDLDWHGPGSDAYVEQATARWRALSCLATAYDELGDAIATLATLAEAA